MPELTYVTAAWCPPCIQFLHVVAEVATSLGLPLSIRDVDIEPEVASQWDVTDLPTLILHTDATEHVRLVGSHAKTDVVSTLSPYVPASSLEAPKVAD